MNMRNHFRQLLSESPNMLIEVYLYLPLWALQMEILPVETLTVTFLACKALRNVFNF